MIDTNPIFSDDIHWPDGINEQIFLDQYWQKKPLLIRQAFPDFDTPLPADELAGLSLEPDTTGKIITQDERGAYHLEHGPFEEERFATLNGNQWSLLVTDVDKHLPEFIAFIQPFRFIPDWRIDDLMISYAPDGASVGAHVDEYDVFLLQASGTRTWSIDARENVAHKMRSDGDLKILANFQPTDTWDLLAGDMLYLPPATAHHGIANGDDCTTWSVGFRAPLIPDLIARMAELLSDRMNSERYTDSSLTPARLGEISNTSIKRFRAIWDQTTQLSDEDFSRLLGCWLTESSAPATTDNTSSMSLDTLSANNELTLEKAPFSRFAWVSVSEKSAMLFVDGANFSCSSEFAQQLCSSPRFVILKPAQLNSHDMNTLQALVELDAISKPV